MKTFNDFLPAFFVLSAHRRFKRPRLNKKRFKRPLLHIRSHKLIPPGVNAEYCRAICFKINL